MPSLPLMPLDTDIALPLLPCTSRSIRRSHRARRGRSSATSPIDLHEVIRQRYEHGSTIFTSNRALEK